MRKTSSTYKKLLAKQSEAVQRHAEKLRTAHQIDTNKIRIEKVGNYKRSFTINSSKRKYQQKESK